MRVLLDTSYLARGPNGSAIYIAQLARALRDAGVDLVEVSQPRRLRAGVRNRVRSAANGLLDQEWLQVSLPREAVRLGADVVHHPLPAHSRRIGVPQVVTVHDLAFVHMPAAYDPLWRRHALRVYRRAARRSQVLICPSQDGARDLEAVFGVERERIVVAPHGPGQAVASEGTAEARHLLFVGGTAPRKNLAGLLAAYAEYRRSAASPLPLVLAGDAASAAGGAPGVEARPRPSPAELVELMGAAAALVHPSLHEGFGMTLLEAMTLGVPVVAVRNAAVEELFDDAAMLVEPDGLARAIEEVAGDAALRRSLAQRGAERAAAFSWERSARCHVEAYTLARESHGR